MKPDEPSDDSCPDCEIGTGWPVFGGFLICMNCSHEWKDLTVRLCKAKTVQFDYFLNETVKMKIRKIQISRLFSLGNFENVKLGYEVEIEEGDQIPQIELDMLQKIDDALQVVKARKKHAGELQQEQWLYFL